MLDLRLLSLRKSIADAEYCQNITRILGVVLNFAAQVADMYVYRSLVSGIIITEGFGYQAFARERHAGLAHQCFENIKFRRREREGSAIQGAEMFGRIERQLSMSQPARLNGECSISPAQQRAD